MKKMKNGFAAVCKQIAKKANGAASVWLTYQPQEPKAIKESPDSKPENQQ